MSSAFSWADRVNVTVNTCLPCLRRPSSTDSLTNPRLGNSNTTGTGVVPNDDLRRLLVDSDSDADALSLHSNIGSSTNVNARARRRSTLKKANAADNGGRGWGITVFGYHLFGRPPQPPIQLPTSSDGVDDDPLFNASNSHHTTTSARHRRPSISAPGTITRTTTLHSTATFDSDAAPLDADTIANLSSTTAADLALLEEEERLAKEERRRKRRERREMKKMAIALAAEASVGDEFEGFQGSGGVAPWPAIPQAFMHEGTGEDASESGTRTTEQRAPSPTQLVPHLAMKEEEEDEGADLDGMTYARRRRPPPLSSQHGGSDSRSRTSGTSASTSHKPTSTPKKTTSKKSKSSRRTKSTLSSNDSTSLASPTSPGFQVLTHDAANTSIATVISPTTVEQGQGFFDYDNGDHSEAHISAYTQPIVKVRAAEGFPSTGFGVRAGAGARGGAFLADTNSNAGAGEDHSFDGTF